MSQVDGACSWDRIPRDIFQHILEYSTDLSSLRLVCKQWMAGVDQNVKKLKVVRLKGGFLGRFVSLTSLELQGSSSNSGKFSRKLVGDMGALKQLRTLKLGKNFPLSGAYLAPLQQLQVLILDHNKQIRSTSLTNLTSLHNLTTLSLAGCDRVKDQSLTPLLDLSKLQTLRLDDAKITDVGLETVAKLPGLTSLSLHSCVLLRNPGIEVLGALKNIRSLNLCFCYWITDDGLKMLAQFSNLRVLDLSYLYKVSDKGVMDLGELSRLEQLSLSYCYNVTDAGVVGLEPLTALTSLDLAYCYNITEEGLRSMRALSNLRKLNLDYCCNLTPDSRTVLDGLIHLTEVKFPSSYEERQHHVLWN